jgi:hypothetical protein
VVLGVTLTIDDGYLTYQMVTIRRLCGKEDDVISLRTVLKKAREEHPQFTEQINNLSGTLSCCDHVCTQVNKHVAHTANPETARNWEEWNMDMKDLETAHKAICQVGFKLNRILHWGCPINTIPVHQYYHAEDLMLWVVPEEKREELNKSWYDNVKRVNAWRRADP